MKKILMLITIIVGCCPLLVKADMDAPAIKSYEATINNPDGAAYYIYDDGKYKEVGKLKYGETIKIDYEFEFDGEIYGNTNLGNIKVKDVLIINDNFDMSDEYVNKPNVYYYSNSINGTVLANKGIKMHNGPASGFSSVGEIIPKGTELKFIYKYMDSWYYVEYKGTKGWINGYSGNIGFASNSKYITPKEVQIIDNNKVVGIIPENTIINNYYELDVWNRNKIYVTYNNISGYVYTNKLGYIERESNAQFFSEIISKIDRNLYETASTKSTILNSDIKDTEEIRVVATIGDHLPIWNYIEYKGTYGWVRNIAYDEDFDKTEIEIIDDNPTAPEIIGDIEKKEEQTKEETKEETKTTKKFTAEQIILLSIGSAVVISLTAFVTIILVNKKKKKKEIEK